MQIVRVLVSVALCVAVCVSAAPHHNHHRFAHKQSAARGEFVAAKAGQHRGPCPALNTLANHGYINRDGKHITQGELKQALMDGMGLSDTFAGLFATAAAKKLFNQQTKELDLKDLLRSLTDNPSGIEHPASLSREDKPTDQSKPSPTQVARTLSCTRDGKMTLANMMECRRMLEAGSMRNNTQLEHAPTWGKTKLIAFLEGILATRVFAGNGKDAVDAAHLRSFLLEERFPNGWVKHTSWGIPELLSGIISAGATNAWTAIRDGAKVIEAYFE